MKKANITKAIVTTTISAIPYVGGPLAHLINEVLNSSSQERIEAFKKEMKIQFEKLDSRFEKKIRESKNFASIFAKISRDAMYDVEEDKAHLYAITMINFIKNESFSDTKIHIFLNILSSMTIAHIDLLKRLSTAINKKNCDCLQHTVLSQMPSTEEKTIELYFSDFEQKQIIQILVNDLYQNRLITSNSFLSGYDAPLGINMYLEKKTTDLGDDFLAFISEHE